MKQRSFHCSAFLVLLIFLIHSSDLYARSLANTKGQEEHYNFDQKSNGNADSIVQMEELMGVEACGSGDVECLERRLISEAHLDYIYTQHHKP